MHISVYDTDMYHRMVFLLGIYMYMYIQASQKMYFKKQFVYIIKNFVFNNKQKIQKNFIIALLTPFVSLCVYVAVASPVVVPDEQRLFEDLMQGYEKSVRPVMDANTILRVTFSLKLNQIIDLVSALNAVKLRNQFLHVHVSRMLYIHHRCCHVVNFALTSNQ